ncbi:Crp/Fnr family transcriptional regulator [Methylobacterium gnaphalii]|uniref:Crp/Fnr family transcriptional regulator n=1 Tax=Methylobacterium gnaphalii TaxID=1010610 RepID=A0A512JRD7_9HYPH|nr:Crp/Fnr family transcriptional regulator [Methylobacterium gnaphalii]GEP12472.1 Crp/Fnr family transcriptional regulator [Methylobacterium gnaphalii]GJD71441.1 hypothetical protein MMMDOFMJ_4400 [Methylobacterium gnaphalii]GLS50592.1 Crp/Fnr family transcriptional regulator [Methylobacterium gnaphalii]
MTLSAAPPYDSVHNRLLAATGADNYEWLRPQLELVPMRVGEVLITANNPIEHVYFPVRGFISKLVRTCEDRAEVGLVGREGFVSTAVALGTRLCPHTSVVQGEGEALRMKASALQAALAEQPTLFRPFGLYTQAFIAQLSRSIYANASFGVEARLARWILMAHDRVEGDELQLTHVFLSAMLAVRRPSVTVTMHVLEGVGAIRNTRGHMIILDRAKLIDLAGDSYQVAEDEYERLMAEA